jgi:uncharacterized protein (TIGR01777 family)
VQQGDAPKKSKSLLGWASREAYMESIRMKILVTGATGFVGKKLCQELFLDGHELVILSRDAAKAKLDLALPATYLTWKPSGLIPENKSINEVEAVINLMGENLASGRWTADKKQRIKDSRVEGTQNLVASLDKQLERPLKAFISYSAIGYYPLTSGQESFDESNPNGQGFLANVCSAWEEKALAMSKTERTVILRVGAVLGRGGGAVAKLLPIFKLGLGGPIGNGQQMMSWIHLSDLLALTKKTLTDTSMTGVYNAVAPKPVTNKEFSKTLSAVLKKPCMLPVPPLALKMAYGEMSTVILDSQAVVSSRLPETGFSYQYGDLKEALSEAAGLAPIGLAGENVVCDQFESFQFIDKRIDQVYDFFAKPDNLSAITPPYLDFHILKVSDKQVQKDTLIDYKLKLHGLPIRWKTLIKEWEPGYQFVDFQLKGPYRYWHHRHIFLEVPGGTAIIDRVDYRLPLGVLGGLVAGRFVKKDVTGIFDYRREAINRLIV